MGEGGGGEGEGGGGEGGEGGGGGKATTSGNATSRRRSMIIDLEALGFGVLKSQDVFCVGRQAGG